MSSIQQIAAHPGLLKILDTLAISSLLFIAGLSFCLSVWVIPNAFLVPPALQLQQFTETFTKGSKFLLPSGRLIMASLLSRTLLTIYHPDPVISKGWTIWALMSGIMILAAPFEILTIFPINDRASKLKRQVEKDRKPLSHAQEMEVSRLMTLWASRNFGRVILPLVAGLIGLLNR